MPLLILNVNKIAMRRFVGSLFSANSYFLDVEERGWFVDAVDLSVFEGETVQGVFVTHSHFDHIYGLNGLLERFPSMVVYTSAHGKEGLYSDKLNFSHYHESSFIFQGKNVVVLKEGDRVSLGNGLEIEVLETPGHAPGCLCYKLGNYLFTGDSFIPGVPTVTKLRGGNKEASLASLGKIRRNITNETIVCPGHGEMVSGKECLEKYLKT